MGISVSLTDIVTLVVALVLFVLATIYRFVGPDTRLGKLEKKYYDMLGGRDGIEKFIRQAATFTELSPDAKRAWVIKEIQDESEKYIGFRIPTSIVDLLVSFVFRKFKVDEYNNLAKLSVLAQSPGGKPSDAGFVLPKGEKLSVLTREIREMENFDIDLANCITPRDCVVPDYG